MQTYTARMPASSGRIPLSSPRVAPVSKSLESIFENAPDELRPSLCRGGNLTLDEYGNGESLVAPSLGIKTPGGNYVQLVSLCEISNSLEKPYENAMRGDSRNRQQIARLAISMTSQIIDNPSGTRNLKPMPFQKRFPNNVYRAEKPFGKPNAYVTKLRMSERNVAIAALVSATASVKDYERLKRFLSSSNM